MFSQIDHNCQHNVRFIFQLQKIKSSFILICVKKDYSFYKFFGKIEIYQIKCWECSSLDDSSYNMKMERIRGLL